ncbi:MAG: 23S rRNA (uracil(1939)-C(5))-methyltransferase RlmD, partial [Bacillota bacterium]
CMIQHQLINRIVRETIDLIDKYEIPIYDEEDQSGLLRHLVVRVGVCTNQAMLVLVVNGKRLPHQQQIIQELLSEIPELVSIHLNINQQQTNVVLGAETYLVAGQAQITDYIGELKYQISPRSFFQVNTIQAEQLYDQILEYAELTGEEYVLDAYCGIGSISLYLAREAKRVRGIEVIPEAVTDAQKNAELNGIDNVEFSVGKVRDRLPALQEEGAKLDVVVVDPPRKGCHEATLETFLELKPQRIIYVSCNPSSLARDLKILTEDEYQVEEVQPVDMFPQTYHIESVAKLVRK